jgi:hypothetical protein
MITIHLTNSVNGLCYYSDRREELVAMAYEVYTRKIRRVTGPSVTFSKQGRLALNMTAAKLVTDLGTDLVLLMWDEAARRVAVKPIMRKDDKRAYKVRFGGKGNTAGFHAATFFDYIGWDLAKQGTTAFPAEWNAEQGLLEFSVEPAAATQQQPPLLAVSRGSAKRR